MTTTILVAAAVLLRILSNPLANVYQKQITGRGSDPLVVSFLTYFLLSLVCVVFAAFTGLSALSGQFWIYSLLGGIAGALGNGFLIKALHMGDLSVLGPINSYKSVVGIIAGIFLLAEIPNLWGVLGICLIIYGSYFVLDTTEERFSWKLFKKPEIQFRIWAMILTAIEAVFVKKVIVASSTTMAFMSWCVFGAFFSFLVLLFMPIKWKDEVRKAIKPDVMPRFVLLIACIGTMQLTTNFAFAYLPVGYALSLFQLSTLVSVLLGYQFFQEKEIGKKIIGSVIMLVGSVCIILLK